MESWRHGFRVTLYKQKEISGGISGGVNQLLELIQLSKILAQPQRTIERWLQQLKEAGQIKYKGSPKTGGYYIKEHT